MAFIGNTNTTQAFAPAIDYFNGNGSTTVFTLSRPVASVAQVQVVVNNVPQNPSDAYTVSGNTITFTSAPSSGTSNIYVYYTSPVTQVVQPSTGTVGKTQLDVYGGTGTGAMTVPTGTTAQRPSVPLVGDTRWNSTLGQLEVWIGSTWQAVASTSYLIDYLVVAGGGGGASQSNATGGGGGAGGFLSASGATVTAGTSYSVVVGAGGAGGNTGAGTSGLNSSIASIATAIGGGNGGIAGGATGGSGGGGGQGSSGGAGTVGQGYAGGNGVGANDYTGGGGGGASAVGGNSGVNGGNGGAGLANSYSGSTVTYAGGGGGGSYAGSGGTGGSGGGGAGSRQAVATSGTVNTGGGGGGSYGGSGVAGAGGSGIVIIRYAGTTARATGGTITITGGYVIHTFTTSGTFTA